MLDITYEFGFNCQSQLYRFLASKLGGTMADLALSTLLMDSCSKNKKELIPMQMWCVSSLLPIIPNYVSILLTCLCDGCDIKNKASCYVATVRIGR